MVAIYTKINWSKHVFVLGVVQSYACPMLLIKRGPKYQ